MEKVLPKSAFVNKFIPKSKFFTKTVVSSKLKQQFSDSIVRITWKYKISEDTLHIVPTEQVQEIQVFDIELKNKEIPKQVLKVIDKTIPYPIFYIFRYQNHRAYGIALKFDTSQSHYFSEWNEDFDFDISGANLEQIYEKLILLFIKDKTEKGDTFAEILETDKKLEKLEKEIAALENKILREKQFNKKVILNKELNALKSQRNTLL